MSTGSRYRSPLQVFGCCPPKYCLESYGISLSNACLPVIGSSTTWIKPICPPNILACMHLGKADVIDWCVEYSEALRCGAWKAGPGLAIDGSRALSYLDTDAACANRNTLIDAKTYPYYVPVMWRIPDDTDPNVGCYRFVILYFYEDDGVAIVFAAQSPTATLPAQFNNILPNALVDWCDELGALRQIGTGGWVRLAELPASLAVCSRSDCVRPASAQVTLSGFDVSAPGCVGVDGPAPFQSASLISIAGVDGVYEVPFSYHLTGRWVYELTIPGATAAARFSVDAACASEALASSGVSIRFVIDRDYNRTVSFAIVHWSPFGTERNMFLADGICFNGTYTNASNATILQSAGSMHVERTP